MRSLFGAVMLATVAGCGSEPCADWCRSIKGELDALGVEVDCNDEEWADAETCEECEEVLLSYGVASTYEDCDGYFD